MFGDVIAGDPVIEPMVGLKPITLRTLIGSPVEVTGDFICTMDPAGPFVPGFLNGAPERIGQNFAVHVTGEERMSRSMTSFLWDGKGNIIPAFTDGIRRVVKGFFVYPPHPGARSVERRKSECDLIVIGTSSSQRRLPPSLVGKTLPDMEVSTGNVVVYGDPVVCVK